MKKIQIDDFEKGLLVYLQNEEYEYKALGVIIDEEYNDYANYFVFNPTEVFENKQNKFITRIKFSPTYAHKGWEFYEINSAHNFKEKYPEYFI